MNRNEIEPRACITLKFEEIMLIIQALIRSVKSTKPCLSG